MRRKEKPLFVGVIPARAGSVGVHNKNLRRFAGKPLIAWAILEALASRRLDRVIVSTNDLDVGRIAKRYGAEVVWRPSKLATATIGIEPALRHVYETLKAQGYVANALVLMMPTNPLRRATHIDEAVRLFSTSKADSVVSVNETPANHTPYWTLVRSSSGKVLLFGNKPLNRILVRRQDFPHKCFARNDIVYAINPANLYEQTPNLYGRKTLLYQTSSLFESDINTPEDWHDAEIKFKRMRRDSARSR